MARGFFGGGATGALIGGLAGGGRGAGIGFGIGAATGLMAGAASSERDRYDDYYDDYQEPSNEYDYDNENNGYFDDTNNTDEMSFNIKDLGPQIMHTAMDETSTPIQPFLALESIQTTQEHKQELETTSTQTEAGITQTTE